MSEDIRKWLDILNEGKVDLVLGLDKDVQVIRNPNNIDLENILRQSRTHSARMTIDKNYGDVWAWNGDFHAHHDVQVHLEELNELEHEGDVIKGPWKKKELSMGDIAVEAEKAFKYQKAFENFAKQSVEHIDRMSRARKAKFKLPTVMSPYQKGINPILAWHYELFDSEHEQFILNEFPKYAKELIAIVEEDMEKLKNIVTQIELKLEETKMAKILYL